MIICRSWGKKKPDVNKWWYLNKRWICQDNQFLKKAQKKDNFLGSVIIDCQQIVLQFWLVYRNLTLPHANSTYVLLSQKVPDFDHVSILLDDNINGEMGIHGAHFVPETLQAKKLKGWVLSAKKIDIFYNSWLCSHISKPKIIYSRAISNVMWKNRRILTKVTPLIMFWTWLQMVRTVASSFLLPHHLSTRSWGITGDTKISMTQKQYLGSLWISF